MAYTASSFIFGEQPSTTKWNLLWSNDATFNALISTSAGHTIIGTNNLRATRFVDATYNILVNADPADTNWHSVSAQAATSVRAYAIIGVATLLSATANRAGYVRKTGSGLAQDATTGIIRNPIAAVSHFNAFYCPLDTNQSFDYSVNNADVSNIELVMQGYWEYVD